MNLASVFTRQRAQLTLGSLGVVLLLFFLYNYLFHQEVQYYPSIRFDPHRSSHQTHSPEPTWEPGVRRVSRLHYLVPATQSKAPLCAGVAAALANGYPIPRILGYKGKGKWDAHAAHIAKLRTIQRYLDNVDAITFGSAKDDDLVIVVDGYDALPELPAGVMIERYFDIVAAADEKLAAKRGISVPELRALGLQQTLLWGTDKGCFPPPATDPRCWLVPFSDLPPYVWGPHSRREEHGKEYRQYTDSRFLNSGTVIGPLGDLRKFIHATLEYIEETFNPEHAFRNSDQYYISSLYARQELQRLLDLSGGQMTLEVQGDLPAPRSGPDDQTEYHLFVDYESAFTQTRCCNEVFIQKLSFRQNDLSATVTEDPFDDGWNFRPFDIHMPKPVFQGLSYLYESITERELLPPDVREWVASLAFYTNVATQHMIPFYHQTCSKAGFVEKYQDTWYYPIIRPLLRAARKGNDLGRPLNPRLIDGRLWIAPQHYPLDAGGQDEFGGVFTDHEEEPFISLTDFCKNDLEAILGTPPNPPSPQAETEASAAD
ncbi:hypothetical protein B0I35DRAFT_99834 [Stachybotrys elegans]|uniref:Uncharacterized protein n=1 Tax=Stachybotrys elegans TaxID=80388 RepID=A0A8K0SI32_9HYPO|nr:hypothetical protein B0I35DRAFT_99834 [Stachybotrys elegans]